MRFTFENCYDFHHNVQPIKVVVAVAITRIVAVAVVVAIANKS